MELKDNKYIANGVIYVGHVKWNDDYKNTVLFDNKTIRNNFFTNNYYVKNSEGEDVKYNTGFTQIKADIIALNPNGTCIIDKPLRDLEAKNYLFFKNDNSISGTGFCCFITDWSITAKGETLLNLSLDIWQQYIYDTTFYQCMIDRAHVSKSNDVVGRYVAPEGITFALNYETDISAFSGLDFTPQLHIDTVSRPQVKAVQGPPPKVGTHYLYGGLGSAENATGLYRWNVSKYPDGNLFYLLLPYTMQTIIKNFATDTWECLDDITQPHLGDVIGACFLPKWVSDNCTYTNAGHDVGGYPDYNALIANNALVSTNEQTVNINASKLANSYTPRNKKMLTSLARVYKLYTKNGLSIPTDPELYDDAAQVKLKLHMRPYGSQYKIELTNYNKDLSKKYIDCAYSFSYGFGLNSNVGVAQQNSLEQLRNQAALLKTNQVSRGINAVMGYVNSTAGLLGQAATGNVSGISSGLSSVVNSGIGIAQAKQQSDIENKAQDIAFDNAKDTVTTSIGSNSDRTAMTNDFCKLRICECNPSIEECRIIDDFLSAYGYAIQELGNPSEWLKTRNYWNYLKLSGANLSVPAPTVYENNLKAIFNSGVTIWHDYRYFGNYNLVNNN